MTRSGSSRLGKLEKKERKKKRALRNASRFPRILALGVAIAISILGNLMKGFPDYSRAYSFQASTKQHSSVFSNLNRRPPLFSQWGSHNQSLPFSFSSWNRVTSLATVVLRVEPWHRGVGNACHLAKDYRIRKRMEKLNIFERIVYEKNLERKGKR